MATVWMAVWLPPARNVVPKALRLPAIEMLKGFDIWQQNPKVDLPLFENLLDVAKIAAEIGKRLHKNPPALSALMIRGHGATVWGERVTRSLQPL